MAPRQQIPDLSSFSSKEVAAFLSSFDTVLTDCDGVLWMGDQQIPGSIETIKKLDEMGKKIFFISNNNLLTVEKYLMKIQAMGYSATKEQILIPGVTIAAYLKSVDFNKKAYVIGTRSLIATLKEAGIDCHGDEPELAETSLSGFKNQITSLDSSYGAVVVDYDPNINYLKMMKAVVLLKKPDCIFVAGATDETVMFRSDLKMIGPGSFLSIMETVSEKTAVILGKPGLFIKDVVSSRHSIVPSKTLMIGDMVKQDILFGNRCGFQTILVLSGVCTLDDASDDPEYKPRYYIQKLGDLLSKL
ncbi:glycerol-3-phosphate phosphatase-like isoform X1 [Schistocerca gregaria]|uniref:glycerol-3-phosphate phosphatase-like isoform X1 n=2 Tax=Schistocerca gregaria TaxID=7010 RepID=UPI00211E681E|nr:glycerol-3-phosphate phosphatase-like isoform X1 [Schistocerca gregaria]